MSLFRHQRDAVVEAGNSADRHSILAAQAGQQDAAAQIRDLLGKLEHAMDSVDRDQIEADAKANVKALSTRAKQRLDHFQKLYDEAQDRLRTGAYIAIDASEAHIRSRPWQTLGVVAGVALLLGAMAFRN